MLLLLWLLLGVVAAVAPCLPPLLYPCDWQAQAHGNEHEGGLQPWFLEGFDSTAAVWGLQLVNCVREVSRAEQGATKVGEGVHGWEQGPSELLRYQKLTYL